MRNKITLLIFVPFLVFSQMTLNVGNTGGNTAISLAQSVTGNGGDVSNATLTCPSSNFGTFTNDNLLGLGSGVVLSTGKVSSAFNNVVNSHPDYYSSVFSTNNQLFASIGNENATDTFDDCILSFDLKPNCDTFKILYTFASEEYHEYVNTGYSDLFAYFITGPNPNGAAYNNRNIALVPNTNTIVSINSINNNTNNLYFVDNETARNNFVFDGYTKELQATIVVTPGATYNIKLGIIDIGDASYDSAIFIKGGSNICEILGMGFIRFDFDKEYKSLFWEFEQNLQLDHFIVEESNDGQIFQQIGVLKPNKKSMFYLNEQVLNFYRITAVKRGGESVLSNTIKIVTKSPNGASAWLFKNSIKIKLENNAPLAEVKLVSASGKVILNKNLYFEKNQIAEIMFSENTIQDGLYFLSITTEYGTETKKILINF